MSDVRSFFEKTRVGFLCFLAAAFNFPLLFSRLHEKSYDAFTHMFFAAHYAESWWNPWNPKWYGGFDQASYPPVAHQVLALISRFAGLEFAYIVVQLLVLVLLVYGIYRYTLLWAPQAAGFAALLGIFLTSVTQCVYAFGQMPTLFSLAFLLLAVPPFWDWMTLGSRRSLTLSLCYLLIVMTSHHLTFFIGSIFFFGPVWIKFLETNPDPFKIKIMRTSIFVGISAVCFLALLYPFFDFLAHSGMAQREIPHPSRGNYFQDLGAFITFFLIPHSFLLLLIPFIPAGPKFKGRLALFLFWALLFVLGLGGRTTPLPQLLTGPLFSTLTFDRFALWSDFLMLPLIAAAFSTPALKRLRVLVLLFAIGCNVFVVRSIMRAEFQPPATDLKRIAAFLDANASQYRYLTLGFGSQMAKLGYLTKASSIDGNYHTARTLPELRLSGIEALDGAKYFPAGVDVLEFVLKERNRLHLKYVFCKDIFYKGILRSQKFRVLQTFKDGTQIWSADFVPPLRAPEEKKSFSFRNFLWGAYPFFFIPLFLIILFSNKNKIDGGSKCSASPARAC